MAISPHYRTILIGCAVLAAFQLPAAHAFSVRATTSITSRHRQFMERRSNIPILLSSSCSQSADDCMSKIEAAGVQRFTKGYNKLCKSCPTRVQPRVDTLTEMILGLPDNEREELMNNVSRRLLETQDRVEEEEPKKVKSSRDVYLFQTSDEKRKMDEEKEQSSEFRPASLKTARGGEEDASAKLKKKMDKARVKFESNKKKSARASHLLVVTNALLSRHHHKRESTVLIISNSVDDGLYHDEMNRLKRLSRSELKLERLKLTAKKAKHDQKIAKQRMKLYGVSVDLANARTKRKSVHEFP